MGYGVVNIGLDREKGGDFGRVEKMLVVVIVVMVINRDSEY